ncbi:hypothetical protein [Rhodopila globiformis]|uniref:Transposase IS204/IS1001/IS1096/IS1165 DDE domain-containing protein n=1 Tax=Rhodopila globiformis TaxID=1071 RepID=A0A2S6MV19_RHOGL|nr:hypothetical protein CCS01_30780 [Rhodopila globiformis]
MTWYFSTHSRLQPVIDAASTIKRQWDGMLEGINSLAQAAKARGYRSSRNLKAMIYLNAGKIEIFPST